MKKLICLIIFLTLTALPLSTQAQDSTIRVGSKSFPENIIIGQMMILALQNAGYTVEDRTDLGNTTANREALLRGEIDVYAEYTGTALNNFYRSTEWAVVPPEAYHDAYLSYVLVSTYDGVLNDLIWLQPAPANNTFVLVVTNEFAAENNLVTMADFAQYLNEGGQVMLATSEEFATRPDGLPAFESVYGFDMGGHQMLVITDATPAITEQMLFQGINGVNAAMAYSTDGALIKYNLTVLQDDLLAQPIYQPAAVFRGEVLRANPEIVSILNPIFASLTSENLQTLNARVEVDGESATDVARSYLIENGFISEE